jgi:hypothetical protein
LSGRSLESTTPQETQPGRAQALDLVADEHAPDVELDPRLVARGIERLERALGGHVEQRRVLVRALGAEVDRLERVAPAVGQVAEELRVLLGRDLVLRPRPQRPLRVEAQHLDAVLVRGARQRALVRQEARRHLDRPLDEVGVAPHQVAQRPRIGEVLRLGRAAGLVPALVPALASGLVLRRAQVEDHPRAPRAALEVLERELAVAARGPARPGGLARAHRLDDDPLGDHEARVEADAELPDQLGRAPAGLAQRLEELARPRARDPAEVGRRLLARHADAVVGDGDAAAPAVDVDPDAQALVAGEQLGPGERLVAQLGERVARVRDQLAQEDLLVRVERVDHQAEQVLDLGLECACLGGGHGSVTT